MLDFGKVQQEQTDCLLISKRYLKQIYILDR